MAQRSQMYYAYFRFYTDETTILAGLEQHCTEWEYMFAVGYNYKEYKCFVDNIGGFEHWVGDMRGYISQTREMGFTDGAPSDSVFDQTLLMGSSRLIIGNANLLNGLKEDTKMIFRRITGKDVGTDHKIEFKTDDLQKIKHPVMYTFDSTQIQLIKMGTSGITDTSDVDEYEIMVDIDIDSIEGAHYSGTAYTNFSNMFDGDIDTYAQAPSTGSSYTTIIKFPEKFSCVSLKGWNTANIDTEVYYSLDGVAWTLIKDNDVGGDWYCDVRNIEGYYIKLYCEVSAAAQYNRIYEIVAS